MSTTLFKLNKRDGFIRRITFPNRPTWPALAARIESLYEIPIEKVCVAYIDADNDEVTLSTQEELEDFYQVSYRPGQAIKFTVQDLSSARVESKALPGTPRSANTFGRQDGSFDIEDDWQRLPPFPGLGALYGRGPEVESAHAFVEVVESDASSISGRRDATTDIESDGHSTVRSNTSNRFPAPLDKGKGKAAADDEISSTGSVIADNASPKHPVHVFNRSSVQGNAGVFSLDPAATDASGHTGMPIRAESTPKVAAQALATPENEIIDPVRDIPDSMNEVADPPLPSLPSPPSLSNDVASLLTTLTNVVVAHPELSEGIRNIVHNTSTGTYWAPQREAISKAAGDIAQATGQVAEEFRKQSELDAGKKIADALSGIFQTLSQTLGDENSSSPQPVTSTPNGEESARPWEGNDTRRATPNLTSFWHGSQPSRGWQSGLAPPPVNPPFYNPWMRSRPSFGQQHKLWGSPWSSAPAPPPPPPPPPHLPPPLHGVHQHGPYGPQHPRSGVWEPEHAPPPPPPPLNNASRSKASPQELRAQVEAAKLRYKTEKERYRQEREERRKERERKAHTTGDQTTIHDPGTIQPPAPSKEPQIVSNARGSLKYPRVEMIRVPRRHNTHPGHGPANRHNATNNTTDDLASRALHRVIKRLSDMGFTESAYPDLPSKAKGQMPPSGVVTKDGEDDIVTTLLEELLAISPRPPTASGQSDIPGAWH